MVINPEDYIDGIIRKQNELVLEFQKKQKLIIEKKNEKEKIRENKIMGEVKRIKRMKNK